MGQTVTLSIPVTNLVNEAAIRRFARYRDEALGLRIRRNAGDE